MFSICPLSVRLIGRLKQGLCSLKFEHCRRTAYVTTREVGTYGRSSKDSTLQWLGSWIFPDKTKTPLVNFLLCSELVGNNVSTVPDNLDL